MFLCGLCLVLVLGGLLGPTGAVLLSLVVYTAAAAAAVVGLRASYPHAVLGLGNAVTLVRLALISALASLLVLPEPVAVSTFWLAFAIAVVALALDGVDGWAARRAGLTSEFGARFDMEVDSGFALLLAALAYHLGHAGVWVLALGLPRYAFALAGWIWPWLQASVPDNLGRKAVCVVQIGVLLALPMPLMPPALGTLLSLGALAALAWSFGRDIRYLRALRG